VKLGSWSFGHFESPNTTHFIKDILAKLLSSDVVVSEN